MPPWELSSPWAETYYNVGKAEIKDGCPFYDFINVLMMFDRKRILKISCLLFVFLYP
jgi:hypothetical protein